MLWSFFSARRMQYRFLTGFQVSHKVQKSKQRPTFWFFCDKFDWIFLLSYTNQSSQIYRYSVIEQVQLYFWSLPMPWELNQHQKYTLIMTADTMALVWPWSYKAWLWPRSWDPGLTLARLLRPTLMEVTLNWETYLSEPRHDLDQIRSRLKTLFKLVDQFSIPPPHPPLY